jgi:hypothetical protein
MRNQNILKPASVFVLCVLTCLSGGAAVAKQKPKTAKKVGKSAAAKPVSKPTPSPTKAISAGWRSCILNVRATRYSTSNMRKMFWYVHTAAYIQAQQKAECSGAGPVPQMRISEPAVVGGKVYVSGQYDITNDRGERFSASYVKSSGAATVTNPSSDLVITNIGMGNDSNSGGFYASLSVDVLLRGTEKLSGVVNENYTLPDGTSETRKKDVSGDSAAALFIFPSGAPRFDAGGRGVDGVNLRFDVRPSPGTAVDAGDQPAADNVKRLLQQPLMEQGLAYQGDYFGASNLVSDNGYGVVQTVRQYIIANNSDGIDAQEIYFSAWISTDGNATTPKDLPPLDRDPNMPMSLPRPITTTPPAA